MRSSSNVIIMVRVVLNEEFVVGDWCFDNQSGSHLQSLVKSVCQLMVMVL